MNTPIQSLRWLGCLLAVVAAQSAFAPWGLAQQPVHTTPQSAKNTKSFTLAPSDLGPEIKTPDGRTVFRYLTKKPPATPLTANSVCCLFPLNTPGGERVVDFAPEDHRHHRGVFLAWHAMASGQRADFWGWGQHAPKEGRVIENRGVQLLDADAQHAVLDVQNDWLIEQEVALVERLTITAREEQQVFIVDLRFELTPKQNTTLEQTAFSGFCVRGRKDGAARFTDPAGSVERPKPQHLKPELNWPAANWYDYTIDLANGKTVGVAVLDHPANPPTTWHNVISLAMLNPCIAAPGPVLLEKDRPFVLRYRLVVHDGPPSIKLLDGLAAVWRASK